MTEPPAAHRRRSRPDGHTAGACASLLRDHGLPAALIVVLVLAAHGASLNDGLFFDDHWHRATLRDYGWSFRGLVESATFDVPGRLVRLWWQEQPLQWRYARPLAMLFMKLELILSGGSPVGVHAFALLWHAAAALLVYALALRAAGRRGWALFAAALFAVHPQSVFAVSWIAARNALVGGCFLLAALALYARGAGLGRAAEAERRGTWRWFAVAGAVWLAALFCRESAIVFPALAVLIDLCAGGWRALRRRVGVHAALWLIAGAYLYWRLFVFPTQGPPSIYFTAPSGLAYASWAASKLLHMVFSLLWHTPMLLGLTTYAGLGAAGVALYAVLAAGVLGPLAAYLRLTPRERGRWLWPLWIAIAFLPVIPVFLMPHFAYVPAAGLAIAVALGLARLRGRLRLGLTLLVTVYTVYCFAVYRYVWRGVVRSEQVIYADVLAHTPRPGPGARLFFINLPAAGIYAAVAMREAWGLDDLEGHVLTFAPDPLMMRQPCVVERTGERELTVSSSGGYFSGVSGRMLLDGMRPGDPLRAGTVYPGEEFDTTVLEADERGVTRLRFRFKRPLDAPEYHFYVSSARRPAARLEFVASDTPTPAEQARLLERAAGGVPEARAAAWGELVALAAPVAELTCAPIQDLLRRPAARTPAHASEPRQSEPRPSGSGGAERGFEPRPSASGGAERGSEPRPSGSDPPRASEPRPSRSDPPAGAAVPNDDDVRRLAAWWREADVSARIDEQRRWLANEAGPLRERSRYFAIFDFFARWLPSDLLLTGASPEQAPPGRAP